MPDRNIDSFSDALKEEVIAITNHLNTLFDIVKDMHEWIKFHSGIIYQLFTQDSETYQPYVGITNGLLELNDEFEIVEMKLFLIKDGFRLLNYILESTCENPEHQFFLAKSRLFNLLQDVLNRTTANADRMEDIAHGILEVLDNPN